MDKEDAVIHTIDYYSFMKRNTFESVLMRWMNLEPIIQSKGSQKEKGKYHIPTHLFLESRKMVLNNLFTETDIENRPMDMRRGEERVRCMDRVTWKLILPYVRQIANRNLLYGSGNSNRGSVSARGVGWGGRWE